LSGGRMVSGAYPTKTAEYSDFKPATIPT